MRAPYREIRTLLLVYFLSATILWALCRGLNVTIFQTLWGATILQALCQGLGYLLSCVVFILKRTSHPGLPNSPLP